MNASELTKKEERLSALNTETLSMLEKIIESPTHEDIRHAYFLSAKAGNADVFKYLANTYVEEIKRNTHYSALLSLSSNQEDISKEYQTELSVFLIEEMNVTPTEDVLINASRSGNLELVKYLLDKDIDVNAKDSMSLRDACEENHTLVVEILTSKGANANCVSHGSPNYGVPLKRACKNGNIDICKILLEQGADINANNSVALYVATVFNHPSLVEFLIENKIDVFANNNKALVYAEEKGFIKISDLINMAQNTKRSKVKSHKNLKRSL